MSSDAIFYGWPLVPACKPVSAPTFSLQPSISGTFAVGNTLTGSAGTVTGFPTPTLSYQWLRNKSPVPGATAVTYALTATDLGARIDFLVAAANQVGIATSIATGSIVALAGDIPSGFAYLQDVDATNLTDIDGKPTWGLA